MKPTVRATYRVQLTPTWGLDRAAGIVDYLRRLGVSHLYTSPLAEATAGSTHGYDVVDHGRVRAELGGPDALRRLWEALDGAGLGLVVDIVPNHMGIRDPANRWWQDVLREGPASRYAGHFDIDWSPPQQDSHGKVVLPFLGATLDEAVRDGSIRVERRADGDGLEVVHHGDRWPVSDASLAVLGLSPADCAERVEGVLADLPASPDTLRELVEAQHWRPVHWRETSALLNWRRFFDVTDLASVRVERPEVFDDVHSLLRSWLDDDLGGRVVQGVRVDHVDGLVDPEGYLDRLRDLVGPGRLVVVEKILAADERLPRSWAVDGTTGYEVTARLDEAVTDPAGAVELVRLTHAATGQDHSWPELVRGCRRLVADRLLRPEVDRLVRAVVAALADDGSAPPADEVRAVVVALAAEMGVYRTYARPGTGALADDDLVELDRAATQVRLGGEVADGVLDDVMALLRRQRGRGEVADEAATRFGQVTAPLAAKAVEDTAFYREVSLPWLAEVGGDPGRPAVALPEVGRALAELQQRWPGTFSPLTTHDTKRSGDVRARLSRLAVEPAAVDERLEGWSRVVAAAVPPGPGPDPALERLLLETLLGAWPLDADRLDRFATKAMREAKLHTSWTDPDEAFEDAVHAWVAAALADPDLVAAVDGEVRRLLAAGRAAALVLVTLAATAVGSPDVYQGDEVWNLVLVDPDNRRAVDHGRLSEVLGRVEAGLDLAEEWRERSAEPDDQGLVKLALWHRLLGLRADHPKAFSGPHTALALGEGAADEVLAFRRGDDVAVLAWCRPGPAPHRPPGTVDLGAGPWVDVLTGAHHQGGTVAVADVLTVLPVAALERA